MVYRCVCTSLEGFVQQLACNYLPHGYWFYVSGIVPESKDGQAVDAKLIDKYGIDVSRTMRSRRKQQELANIHYLRFERLWILAATHGRHEFFAAEEKSIRDIRRQPFFIGGYSITVQRGGFLGKADPEEPTVADNRWRVRVQIARRQFQATKAYLQDLARFATVDTLVRELQSFPYEPYAPVFRQFLALKRAVDKTRKQFGRPPVPDGILRTKRRIVTPFE